MLLQGLDRRMCSKVIGFLAPGLCLEPKFRTSRFSATLHAVRRDPDNLPSCSFTPLRGNAPEGFARHLSMRAPLLRIPCRLTHTFRRKRRNPKGPNRWVKLRIQGFPPSLRFDSSFGLVSLFHPTNAFRLFLQGFPLLRSSPNFHLDGAVMPLFRGCAPTT